MAASLRVLHEDERLVAVDKPSGRIVVPGRGPSSSRPAPADMPEAGAGRGHALEDTVLAEVERRLGRKVFVVHRLDRGASGVLLFAKDAAAHRELSIEFERRAVRKVYWAAVRGRVSGSGRLESPLKTFGSGRVGAAEGGKASLTLYRARRYGDAASLLEVEPRTGRRHQIRVHLYNLGHPILGDDRYGSPRPVGGAPRLMLHALELELRAGTKRALLVRAEPSEDFLRVLRSFSIDPGPPPALPPV